MRATSDILKFFCVALLTALSLSMGITCRCAAPDKTLRYLESLVVKHESDSTVLTSYAHYINGLCFQIEDFPDASGMDYTGLFDRPSFISIGDELFSRDFLANMPDEYSGDYIYDYRLNYLFLCDNDTALMTLGDLFLKECNTDGLMGLLEKLDISALPHYNSFLYNAIISNRTFDLYLLIIFAKNSGLLNLQKYLEKAARLMIEHDSEVENTIYRINTYNIVSYEDFINRIL